MRILRVFGKCVTGALITGTEAGILSEFFPRLTRNATPMNDIEKTHAAIRRGWPSMFLRILRKMQGDPERKKVLNQTVGDRWLFEAARTGCVEIMRMFRERKDNPFGIVTEAIKSGNAAAVEYAIELEQRLPYDCLVRTATNTDAIQEAVITRNPRIFAKLVRTYVLPAYNRGFSKWCDDIIIATFNSCWNLKWAFGVVFMLDKFLARLEIGAKCRPKIELPKFLKKLVERFPNKHASKILVGELKREKEFDQCKEEEKIFMDGLNGLPPRDRWLAICQNEGLDSKIAEALCDIATQMATSKKIPRMHKNREIHEILKRFSRTENARQRIAMRVDTIIRTLWMPNVGKPLT